MSNYWTYIIKPKSHFFDFNLKEIWQYRDLVWIFAKRDIAAVYKQTILGPLWYLISPLITVVVFTFVFSDIAKISTDNIPAPLFYLAGTTLWNYFQTSFLTISSTFVTNKDVFGKVYFPRVIVPISVILSSLLKFLIQLCIFTVVWFYFYSIGEINLNATVFVLPLLVCIMAALALGTGIIISAFTTKYRDVSFFIGFAVSLLMYATPVIYPVSAIPEMYKDILWLNPVAPVIEAFRYGFCGAGVFSWAGLAYSAAFAIFSLFFGILIFNRTEKTFMDTV